MPVANPNKVKMRKDEMEQRASSKRLISLSSKRLTSGEDKPKKSMKKGTSRHARSGSDDVDMDVDQEQSYVFDHQEDARARRKDEKEVGYHSRSRSRSGGDIEDGGGSQSTNKSSKPRKREPESTRSRSRTGDIENGGGSQSTNKSSKSRKREPESKYGSRANPSMENSYDLDELEQSSDSEFSVEVKEGSSTSKTLIMEDSGHSTLHGSQGSNDDDSSAREKNKKTPIKEDSSSHSTMHGSQASNDDYSSRGTNKKRQEKPRKSHAVHVSMTGDIDGESTKRAPSRSKSADDSGDVSLRSSESRSTSRTTDTRTSLSKGKSTRRGPAPPRSKSSDDAGDVSSNSKKPHHDSRKTHTSSRSGDSHKEDYERRVPPRTTSSKSTTSGATSTSRKGKKPADRDLQGMFDEQVPLRSTDARSTLSSKEYKSTKRPAPSRTKSSVEFGGLGGWKSPLEPRSKKSDESVGSSKSKSRKPPLPRSKSSYDAGESRSKKSDESVGSSNSRKPPPPRSKSSDDAVDFFDTKKSLDSQKAKASNESEDLQQEDFERRVPPKSKSSNSMNSGAIGTSRKGKKPVDGDLQGMFDEQVPLRSTDARSVDDTGSRDSVSKSSKSVGGRITVKMRDTDRLLRGRSQGIERQESSRSGGSGLQRQGSVRPGVGRQDGGRNMSREPSRRDDMAREPSRSRSTSREPSSRGEGLSRGMTRNHSMSREPSSRDGLSRGMSRNRSMSREPSSRDGLSRGMSRNRSMSREPSRGDGLSRGMSRNRSMSREPSRGDGLSRGMSRNRSMSREPSSRGDGMSRGMSRSRSMSRDPSRGNGLSRGMSRSRSMSRANSSRHDRNKPESARSARFGFGRNPSKAEMRKSNRLVQVAPRDSGAPGSQRRYNDIARRYLRENLESPPKSLVIIWLVVAAELGMDLVTTIISFMALVQESECCGQLIDLGPLPLAVTVPFFVLIVTELAFLFRAIKLTLWPAKIEDRIKVDEAERSRLFQCLCGCYHWNVKVLFKYINWLVLLNPFFGSVVAWMLLYQSSKQECFAVLGLEAASLLLHFLSVYLEGETQTLFSILFHCIPVLPFFVSIVIILVYLQQGGVCYLVETSLFWYEGCQYCEVDNFPPDEDEDGVFFCRATNDTLALEGNVTLLEVDHNLLPQQDFCSPERNFCFFSFDE